MVHWCIDALTDVLHAHGSLGLCMPFYGQQAVEHDPRRHIEHRAGVILLRDVGFCRKLEISRNSHKTAHNSLA